MSWAGPFESTRKNYLVSKSPSEIEEFLMNNEDQVVNKFLSNLSQQICINLQESVVKLFQVLKFMNLSLNNMNLTEKLLKVLFEAHSKLGEESQHFIENYCAQNFLCVDPDSINTLHQKFKFKLDKNIIMSQAFYLIMINFPNKAIKLLKDFNFIVSENQDEYDSKFNLIKTLIIQNNIKSLSLAISTNKVLAKKSIEILSEHHHTEEAEYLIKENNWNYLEFPIYVKKSAKRSLSYFLFEEKLTVSVLIELTDDDIVARGALIEILFEGSFKCSEFDWMGKVATCLLKSDIRVKNHVEPSYLPKSNRDIVYREAEDTFKPVLPNCTELPQQVEVILVDSEQKLAEMTWDGETYVGVDSEWKTGIGGKFIKTKNAILQLAFTRKVYIIDLTVSDILDQIDKKLYELFGNSNIAKVGISFAGDMAKLRESFPEMLSFQCTLRSYVDLIEVHKRNKKSNPGGLGNLCEIYLDISVCKTEQISNWERRPLRNRQLHYAALDAYLCMALIYRYFELNFIAQADFVDVFGAGEKGSNGNGNLEKYCATCDCCKSIKHQIESCPKFHRCRICGFADHQARYCPCLVEG